MSESCEVCLTKEEKRPVFPREFELIMRGKQDFICDRLISQYNVKKKLLHSNNPSVIGYQKSIVSWS